MCHALSRQLSRSDRHALARGSMHDVAAGPSCSWKPSAEPATYDCRAAELRLPLWSQVCRKAAAKYQGYQPNLRSLGLRECNGTRAHAHRMLRQLDGRTVAVLGDSHALNLWCALTCWFSSAPGVLVERRDQPASLTIGRLANFSYGMTHVEDGVVRSRVAWMLPACYRSSGNRCGDPTSMSTHPTTECSFSLAEKLAAATENAGQRVVLLSNPCGVYFGDPVLRAVSKFMRANEMGAFAAPSNLLKAAMEGVTMDTAWRTSYGQRASRAAKVLARLRNGSMGILVESAVPHFAAHEADLADVDPILLDDEGSYGRFTVSGGLWLHRIARMPNASAALQAYRIARPAFSSWKQSAGNFPQAIAFGPASACGDDTHCIAKHRTLLARSCAPRKGGSDLVDWRIATERAAAASAGITTLRSFEARLSRFDVHPGLQGGSNSLRSVFDCSHSSLVPGAYDGEVLALASALNLEAAAQKKTENALARATRSGAGG